MSHSESEASGRVSEQVAWHGPKTGGIAWGMGWDGMEPLDGPLAGMARALDFSHSNERILIPFGGHGSL